MSAASHRAARKPAKGGVPNALFVLAPIEALPPELDGVASSVTALFPWGSLLRSLVVPGPDVLCAVRRLCAPGARFELVTIYDTNRERTEIERLGLPPLTREHLRGPLAAAYERAGLRVTHAEQLSRDDLRGLPSTWAKRLAFGRPRDVWRLRAKVKYGLERNQWVLVRGPTPPP